MSTNTDTDIQIAGICTACGRSIPHGYLYTVLRWEVKRWGTRPVQVASEIVCRDCSGKVEPKSKPRKQEKKKMADEPIDQEEEQSDEQEETEAPSPAEMKQIAVKLLGVMSTESAHGSKLLCQKAGIEYSEYIVPILKKLEAAGKVVRIPENGWWRRA